MISLQIVACLLLIFSFLQLYRNNFYDNVKLSHIVSKLSLATFVAAVSVLLLEAVTEKKFVVLAILILVQLIILQLTKISSNDTLRALIDKDFLLLNTAMIYSQQLAGTMLSLLAIIYLFALSCILVQVGLDKYKLVTSKAVASVSCGVILFLIPIIDA